MSTPDESGDGRPVGNTAGIQGDEGTHGVIDDQVEERPEFAATLFGDHLDAAERYAEHLATTGVEWGLIGPRELPRLWTRHILNCGVAASLLEPGDVVGDIGSGAGLPGIPWALARPDASFVLIESMERRVEWLRMVVQDLGLENVRIVRARVEDLVDEEMFTVVTARAVKAMTTLIEWSVPILGPEGRILAIKGASVQAELDKAARLIRKRRLQGPTVHSLGADDLPTPTTVVELRRS